MMSDAFRDRVVHAVRQNGHLQSAASGAGVNASTRCGAMAPASYDASKFIYLAQ